MSENLDLVRSIYADWERGDFKSIDWAHPDVELVAICGPDAGSATGTSAVREGWRGFMGTWRDLRIVADSYREIDGWRVLVFVHWTGRGKTSGLDLGKMASQATQVFHLREVKVTRLVNYVDRDRALADLGLEE